MKPGNHSARGASRSSWGSLSGFALYFFPATVKQTTLWPRHRWRLGGKDGAATGEDVTPPPSWKEGDGATPSFPLHSRHPSRVISPGRGQHTQPWVKGIQEKPALNMAAGDELGGMQLKSWGARGLRYKGGPLRNRPALQ
ncbi:hypothetical protein LSM04_002912 [Trypanosoma melophagium]|uniref:uncharacterized protein n=1 Tax=Trypanosoma melophagium TaxID=715481 RepID=UPI00351A2CB9|nr:hypothetical protein LSM04_002912 [Trypanosoma melophagium]